MRRFRRGGRGVFDAIAAFCEGCAGFLEELELGGVVGAADEVALFGLASLVLRLFRRFPLRLVGRGRLGSRKEIVGLL